MPLEIKELHIIVSVNAGSGDESPGEAPSLAFPEGSDQQIPDKEAIIAECVEQVMEILKEKEER